MKTVGMMVLGAGIGAGTMFMIDQYKAGNLSKTMEKGAKALKPSKQ